MSNKSATAEIQNDSKSNDSGVPAGAISPELTVEECVEKAKRAFALRKYEQAVDNYASALELMTSKYGDGAPEAADLYFSYGKALLENAIAQTAVLGKEQAEEALAKPEPEEGSSSKTSGPFISFSGDADDSDVLLGDGEDVPVDLFGEAKAAAEEEEKQDEEENEEEGEPEDDFNAAWEVLDLARALYEKQKDEDDKIKLKLADTYIALGDVSLETEKFDQAIADYTEGVTLKSELLPQSSRQIAEAHYKLSIVLDLTSGRLAQAVDHAQKALDSVGARLAELQLGISGQLPPAPKPDVKGKGKGKTTSNCLVQEGLVQEMSKTQIEAEIKELEELKEDLALKVEELKNPEGAITNAAELAARALDRELNLPKPGVTDPAKPVLVNDLTTMVKKKRKVGDVESAELNGKVENNGKRKAEDVVSTEVKKAKVEDASEP